MQQVHVPAVVPSDFVTKDAPDDRKDGALQLVIYGRLCCRDTERRTFCFQRREALDIFRAGRKWFCTSDHKH